MKGRPRRISNTKNQIATTAAPIRPATMPSRTAERSPGFMVDLGRILPPLSAPGVAHAVSPLRPAQGAHRSPSTAGEGAATTDDRPGSMGRRGARRRPDSPGGCRCPVRADSEPATPRSTPRRTSPRTIHGTRRRDRGARADWPESSPRGGGAAARRRTGPRLPTDSADPPGRRAAAFSHSASVGSRAPSHSANAAALSHEIPTTGCSGASKPVARQKAVPPRRSPSSHAAHCAIGHRRRGDAEGVHPHACAGRSAGMPARPAHRERPRGDFDKVNGATTTLPAQLGHEVPRTERTRSRSDRPAAPRGAPGCHARAGHPIAKRSPSSAAGTRGAPH